MNQADMQVVQVQTYLWRHHIVKVVVVGMAATREVCRWLGPAQLSLIRRKLNLTLVTSYESLRASVWKHHICMN